MQSIRILFQSETTVQTLIKQLFSPVLFSSTGTGNGQRSTPGPQLKQRKSANKIWWEQKANAKLDWCTTPGETVDLAHFLIATTRICAGERLLLSPWCCAPTHHQPSDRWHWVVVPLLYFSAAEFVLCFWKISYLLAGRDRIPLKFLRFIGVLIITIAWTDKICYSALSTF